MKIFLVYMDYVDIQVCTHSSSAQLEFTQSYFCQSSFLTVWQATCLLLLNILLTFAPDPTQWFLIFGNSYLEYIHPKTV